MNANPNTNVIEGALVTVGISNIQEGKQFASIGVVGDDSGNPVSTTQVTAGVTYTFNMPAEDVTVTVTLEEAPLTFLYKDGTEYVSFVNGYDAGLGTQRSKQSDHLFLQASLSGETSVAYVTDDQIDLTGVSGIKVRWSNTGDNDSTNYSQLIASTSKGGSYTVFDARLQKTGTFSLTNDTLNVSGLNGLYYIRVHATSDSGPPPAKTSEVKVYEIELIY